MSRARKRPAVSSGEEDDDLWGEDTADVADPSTAKPRKRTRQTSLIEDVVGEEGEGGDGDEFNDGFDEDLYGDDEDRRHLDSLAEVEREEILYQRAEKRRELEERREAKRKASGQAGKRPVGGTGRTRSVGTRSGGGGAGGSLPDALADLIERRHKRTTTKPSESVVLAGDDEEDEGYDDGDQPEPSRRRQQVRRFKAKERSDSEDEDGGEDEGGGGRAVAEDDVEEEAEKERKKSEARFSIPGSHTPLRLTDLKLIQLRRDRLEKIFEEPYFHQIVKGMVVRVTVGQDTKRNAPKYLVGEIVEVGELKQRYPFPSGTSRTTRVALLLQRGEARRLFAMSAISNQSITEDEFLAYSNEVKKANLPLMTAEEALERKKKAEFLKETYVYTPELVAKMVDEKKGRGKQVNITLERTKMEIELGRAKNAVDALKQKSRGRKASTEDEEDSREREAEEEALQAEERRVEAVENKLAELRELELKQQKTAKGRTEMTSILELNRRNQTKDIADARSMFFENEKIRKEEEERLKAQGKKREVTLDPFKRRATRPSINFEEEEEVKEAQPREETKEEKVVPVKEVGMEGGFDLGEAVGMGGGKVGRGLLSFAHPPSLSDLMMAQMQMSHKGGGDIDVERVGEVRGAAGGTQREASRMYSKYSVLPANERVVSVSEYWARREQA